MKPEKIKNSKRKRRFMSLAKNISTSSDSKDYGHGAVLAKGSNIINIATNKNSHARFGKRFRKRDCGHTTHHAELGCVLGIDRSVTKGSVMYVTRIGKKGELRMSKPCEMCEAVLKHVGVKKVIYSINEDEIGYYNL